MDGQFEENFEPPKGPFQVPEGSRVETSNYYLADDKQKKSDSSMGWPGAVAFIAFLAAVCYIVTVIWG